MKEKKRGGEGGTIKTEIEVLHFFTFFSKKKLFTAHNRHTNFLIIFSKSI